MNYNNIYKLSSLFLKLAVRASMTKSQAKAILGLSGKPSNKEINDTYRSLSKKLHPDINPAPNAQQKIVELNEARSVLLGLSEAIPEISDTGQYRQPDFTEEEVSYDVSADTTDRDASYRDTPQKAREYYLNLEKLKEVISQLSLNQLLEINNCFSNHSWDEASYFVQDTQLSKLADKIADLIEKDTADLLSLIKKLIKEKESRALVSAFKKGDAVTIKSGPFASGSGEIVEISPDENNFLVIPRIFGRNFPPMWFKSDELIQNFPLNWKDGQKLKVCYNDFDQETKNKLDQGYLPELDYREQQEADAMKKEFSPNSEVNVTIANNPDGFKLIHGWFQLTWMLEILQAEHPNNWKDIKFPVIAIIGEYRK